MFTWRRQVPVLYVFAEQCVLVLHAFRHFVDLRHAIDTPIRHWPTKSTTATKDAANASSGYITVDNESRINLPPAILANINDLRTERGTTKLKEAFLAEQSEFRLASENTN